MKTITAREFAAIKRVAQNVSAAYSKAAKITEKISKLTAEYQSIQNGINLDEAGIVDRTGMHTMELVERVIVDGKGTFKPSSILKWDDDAKVYVIETPEAMPAFATDTEESHHDHTDNTELLNRENKKTFSFMAIAAGRPTTTNSISIKRYIGIAPSKILAVNPTKEKLSELYGTEISNDIVYTGVQADNTGNDVPYIRVDFIVKPDVEGVDFITKASYFVRKAYKYKRDNSKVQVIDPYGRTAWVTKEQCAKHEIPMYSNGKPANISSDYRPCYVGEEELVQFVRKFLNVPNVQNYINGEWVMSKDPSASNFRFDKIEDWFKGDIKEIIDAIGMQPENSVKIVYGVKTTDDGRHYQDVYTQMVLTNNARDYSKLQKSIDDRKANGAYSTTEFSTEPLKEYTVEATEFNPTEDLPFGEAEPSSPWNF